MNNDQGYCGFADWPPCTEASTLALTGTDLAVIVVVAAIVVVVGIFLLAARRWEK